ncbi:mechanosensitive ion channel family protein [Halopiger aswanensis]|uniref:Small-conductance mechanosensitive channel n=1 Tax=Halopiger aswanensis TaxID=148449 RepID=A0A419WIF5_9EURY|nr:mechanosensitive ion channel family protein [Halopiger aswanensis]RKD95239.1 small-conductance mechanosensitive channel [Halopiger aswanensis]
MVGALTELDRLGGELVQTTELKLVVTFAAVGLLLFVLLSYRQLQTQLSERLRSVYGELISTTILVGTCAGTAAVVLGVWEQANTIVDIYQQQLGFGEDVLAKTIVSIILLIATYLFTRFLRQILDEVLGSSSAVTDHQREITHRITQVIIWSVSLVVVLGYWVDDLGGLLVGAGFLGIVVGMAARQTLGTVLAGFVLMFARPFEIGDWIEVEDEQGIVTDISIVNTRLRSFDGEYVMIPNDVISSSTVTNRSRRGRLRLEVEVGVDYETDLEHAAEIAESVVGDLEYSLAAPGPQVVGKEFGDSAIVLGVRFWIDKPSARRHWRARTAAINAIKDAFDDEGIKIPFPQQELSGRAETGGFRIAGDGAESAGADGDREQQLTPPEGN